MPLSGAAKGRTGRLWAQLPGRGFSAQAATPRAAKAILGR